MEEALVIGIAGGSGSGKTTIVRQIAEVVPDFAFFAQDNYYRDAADIPLRKVRPLRDEGAPGGIDNQNITEYNFDHPDAFDTGLLARHLAELRAGRSIRMPSYDFVHHRRSPETTTLESRPVIVFEGILILFPPELRKLIDLKIYVDTPDDIRFIRRLRRDVAERGRTQESVISQYLDVVRPSHYQFIEPTKAYADLIIPEGGSNRAALDVLANFIRAGLGRR